jgi:hypothetical protein
MRVSNRLGLPMSTPCPKRTLNSPSLSPDKSASSAAAATVALPVAGSSDQITTKADPAFARYREHLLGLVMNR